MTLANGLKIWLGLDQDPTADRNNWTLTDVTPFVLLDQGGVTIEGGYPEGSDEAGPTHIGFLADNTDGRWAPGFPGGAWFGRFGRDTPLVVTFDNGSGAQDLGVAFLGDLPQDWTPGGLFKTVRVDAFGVLQRLEQADPLTSYARQLITSKQYSLVYYVPCEDAAGSTRLVSAVPGQPDVTVLVGLNLAADTTYTGCKPLPTLSATGYTGGTVLPYDRPSPEAWTMMRVLRVPARPAATVQFHAAFCDDPSSTVRRWIVEFTNATPSIVALRGYNAAGTELLADAGQPFNNTVNNSSREPFGEQLVIEINVAQSGTGISWALTIAHESNFGTGTSGTLASSTLGPVTRWGTGPDVNMDGWTVGEVALFAASGIGASPALSVAIGGKTDTTNTRFNITAATNGVPNSINTSAGELMGSIPDGRLIDILRDAQSLERGLLFEDRHGRLFLRSRLANLINRSVGMAINYASGHLTKLTPIDPIRTYANRATVSRPGGISVTVDATGQFAPSVTRVARTQQFTMNAQVDTNLPYYAQWEDAVATVPEPRYTAELEFGAGAASLLDAWLAMRVGDRITIANPPSWTPPDTIDQYLRGYAMVVSRLRFSASIRTVPYRPYLAWTVEGSGNTGRADTSGCRLLAAVSNVDTSAIVGTYGDPGEKTGVAAKWSTSSVPYDLALRLVERVTATAVTNNAATFVAAGAAAAGDNATLVPALPAGLTVGDLLLCVASIRAAPGKVVTPAGWTRISIFGSNENAALFARQYVSGDAAPSVAFTGGAAGDTTLAQCAAFRFLQPVVHNRAIRLANGSAQDIATPGLGVVRDGCVAIVVGAKQDDLTSSTPPAGFTEIGRPSSTLGNDASLVWAYAIQTTATRVASGTYAITGGAAATSIAGMVMMLGDVQTLTLTRGANGAVAQIAHPAGTDVALWRAGWAGRP